MKERQYSRDSWDFDAGEEEREWIIVGRSTVCFISSINFHTPIGYPRMNVTWYDFGILRRAQCCELSVLTFATVGLDEVFQGESVQRRG